MTGIADIGVVVVCFQSAATIERCLSGLLASPRVARLVVVDNASSDDGPARVAAMARQDRRLSLIRQDGNPGYASACNTGASALATPWVLFVNPDAYPGAADLERLLAHARARPAAGLIGVDVVDEMGRPDPAARRADPTLEELREARGRREAFLLGRDPDKDLQPVPACSGAVMLMPMGLFVMLGGFDPAFRLHAEDLDLCRRVRESGHEVCVANDVTVVHVGGVSSRARPLWVEWHKHRGLWRYFHKFEGRRAGLGLRALAWLAIMARFVAVLPRTLLRGR